MIRNLFLTIILVAVCAGELSAQMTQDAFGIFEERFDNGKYHFIVINDAGYNGYKYQIPIAKSIGEAADISDAEFIISNGDQHHFHGVTSIYDPMWTSNFEIIYTHPSILEIPWYAVAGNHEYRGSVDAFIQYNTISSRWKMPSRYYTFVKKVDKNCTLRIVMLDTTPMMDHYRKEGSDASLQDYKQQIEWLDSVLNVSKEDWTIVFGHHPIFAASTKDSSELRDMQNRLDPILRKHRVSFYICGHIHNFQHIIREDSPVTYIVNSSASSSRSIKDTTGLSFSSNEPGFSICEVDKNCFSVSMISSEGTILYSIMKKQ